MMFKPPLTFFYIYRSYNRSLRVILKEKHKEVKYQKKVKDQKGIFEKKAK